MTIPQYSLSADECDYTYIRSRNVMLCQNCKKREATVNHIETVNGKLCEVHLCELCAGDMFSGFEAEFENAVLSGLLGRTFREERVCPACGMAFNEYKKSGLLGCPSCYDVFNEELRPYINRIQGSSVHVGKGGGIYTSEHDIRLKLAALRTAMDEALSRGDYAEAGRINEQMNAIKKRTGGGV